LVSSQNFQNISACASEAIVTDLSPKLHVQCKLKKENKTQEGPEVQESSALKIAIPDYTRTL
jgi:hypothetical protein